jgi:mono/diheme cytochrome c family protein
MTREAIALRVIFGVFGVLACMPPNQSLTEIVFASSAGAPSVRAQSQAQGQADMSTIWGGVFSDIQARRGEKVASTYCSGCHGPDLGGGDSGPKLVGPIFLNKWNDKTVWDLFDWIKTSMPEDNPGSLSQESTANVIAYILEMNKVSSGTKDLPVDQAALSQIRIVEQAPQK